MRQLVLADDSTTIQKVIQLSFADEDFEIHTFANGPGALEYLRNYSSDILLADISLPHLDGYDLCREIRQDPRTSELPVVLLAGTFEPFDAERALQVGYTSLLVKPFETGKLVDLVKKLVSRAVKVTATAKVEKSEQIDRSDSGEGEEDTPRVGMTASPLPVRVPVPAVGGKIRFDLSPAQCRVEEKPTRSKPESSELSTEQVDDLVEKVIERLPATLRTLVPDLAKNSFNKPSEESD